MNARLRMRGASASWCLRMMVFDALQSLGTWRWLLVAPGFAMAAYLFKGSVAFDSAQQRYLDVSPVDLALAYQVFSRFLLWVVALGFAFLVGDSALREAENGTRMLSLLRAPSRDTWWIARLGSIGLQALLYAALGLVGILVAGALMFQGGGELSPSMLELGIVGRLRAQWPSVPSALLVVSTALYLAWGLWLYGSILVTASLLVSRPFVPVATAVIWLVLCVKFVGPELRGKAELLNVAYLLSYQKHLGAGAMTLGSFFVLTGAALAGVMLLGIWRARRVEL